MKQPTGASTTAAASCSATTTSAGLCGSTGSQIGAGGCVSPSAGGQNGAGGGGVGAPGSYGEGRECLRPMSDHLMLPPLFAIPHTRTHTNSIICPPLHVHPPVPPVSGSGTIVFNLNYRAFFKGLS